jgi:hypothetical protein
MSPSNSFCTRTKNLLSESFHKEYLFLAHHYLKYSTDILHLLLEFSQSSIKKDIKVIMSYPKGDGIAHYSVDKPICSIDTCRCICEHLLNLELQVDH